MEGKDLIFRAHAAGKITPEARGTSITEKQLEKIDTFEDKIKKGGTLTANQREEYKRLKDKRDTPPELGDTAKSHVQDLWLWHEKGYKKTIKSKYLDKGLYGEEEGLSLISELDNEFYVKNTERKNNGIFQGECDVFKKINSVKVVQDIKCSYDPSTFYADDIDYIWQFQGDVYMELWDADEFWIRKCLLDCPPHIYEKEKYYLKSEFNIIDEDVPEVRPLFEQLERNLIYSTNPNWTKEERVRTYKFQRDPKRFQLLMDKVPLAREYYDILNEERNAMRVF